MALWLADVERRDYGTTGGSFTGGPPKGVLHTTESTTWPTYRSGTVAPHLTAYPDTQARMLRWRQHTPLDVAARALRNESGGVQTNRDSAVQIELVGTCNPAWRERGYYFWPGADQWALDGLAEMMRRLEATCGIARVGVEPFLPYPASYGASRARLSLSQWDNYSGWVGHQHVPENDHGDPGNLAIGYLVSGVPAHDVPPVVPPVPPAPPPYPLPAGHYFGPRSGPVNCHSGYYSATDRAGLRTWQARMRARGWEIGVDGLYGPQTAGVARAFQREKGLAVDALIGAVTWRTAWSAPVT